MTQLELEALREEETPVVAAAVDEPEVENTRRCGGRFDWAGRPLRCSLPTRHSGWHVARPRRDATVKWNDSGSYESVELSAMRRRAG